MNYDKKIYELMDEHDLSEIGSVGYVFKHIKSGARVMLISNDDENKVFSIGFRTPPPDSTGVPHILEHSVLCGSKKYPAKDPFVELVKGSLNTFLNAMTFSDKTIYPIASCNDVDFKNLTDVYMDSVFNPNIYQREQIFKQEGWHYELESLDAPLKYNGVVYNEMKGAFSSADGKLDRLCLNSLYPDTAYSTESGGDPEFIPDLTYENFLGFHKKLYHPANSYIYIYGNCDMSERLEYLDREYLSKYDAIEVDSELTFQKPFDKMDRVCESYSVTEEEGTNNKTYLAYNVSTGTSKDSELITALRVLDYVLFGAPGAPIKQAIIDAGIGEDVYARFDTALLQPRISIVASNTNADREEEFVKIIKESLAKVVKEGINKKSLRATITAHEFSYREADFGRAPKGLIYGINILASWLYDDNQPFVQIEREAIYKSLKEKVDTDYFEKIVEKYLINNTHASTVVLTPEIGLTAKNDAKTAEKLAEYKKSLSEEELLKIIEDTKALKKYQEEPSTKEELESIPMLSRSDISRDVLPIVNAVKDVEGVKVIHHNIHTNKIGYLRLDFSLAGVPDELLPYAGLLSRALAIVDTKKHAYTELSDDINLLTGGIHTPIDVMQIGKGDKAYRASLGVVGKALYEDFENLCNLSAEIILDSLYDDTRRLRDVIGEAKMGLQSDMEWSGNSVAIAEVSSQASESGAVKKAATGRDLYKMLDDLYKNYDEKKDEMVAKLKEVSSLIFSKKNLMVSFTADEKGYEEMLPHLKALIAKLPDTEIKAVDRKFEPKKVRLGLKSAGQVTYVVRAGDYSKAGFEYNGALNILETMMGYDYLWINVRVKGGAYGCGANFGSRFTGRSIFYSYRDPNLRETNAIYDGVTEYIKNYNSDEREMTKSIIGTISGMDTPLNPAAKGDRSYFMYLSNTTEADLVKTRNEVLDATPDDIKALAPQIKAVLDDGYFCVVGCEEKINACKDMFDVIETLL